MCVLSLHDVEPRIAGALTQSLQYNLSTLEGALPDLLEQGLISAPPSSSSTTLNSPAESLRLAVAVHAVGLVPRVIGLTDAFGFTDYDLDSDLGRADGRVYEALLTRAQRTAEANVGDATARKAAYHNHVEPILERGRRLSRL